VFLLVILYIVLHASVGSIIKQEHQDKMQGSLFKNNKTKSYSKHDNQNVHVVDYDEDEEEYLKISEYFFSVGIGDVLLAMQDLGDRARWPRKTDKIVGYKDKSKWCAYHEDFGHVTDECIALRRYIGYLLSKGHFKELFGRKKQRIQDPEKVHEKAAQPPFNARVINYSHYHRINHNFTITFIIYMYIYVYMNAYLHLIIHLDIHIRILLYHHTYHLHNYYPLHTEYIYIQYRIHSNTHLCT